MPRKRLHPHHKLAAILVVLGRTPPEIAAETGLSLATQKRLRQDSLFCDEVAHVREAVVVPTLQDRRAEMTAFVEEQAMPSLQHVAKLRDTAESEQVQLKASTQLIDYSQFGRERMQEAAPRTTQIFDVRVMRELVIAAQKDGATDVLAALGALGTPAVSPSPRADQEMPDAVTE